MAALGLSAACVPGALLVVEKLGSRMLLWSAATVLFLGSVAVLLAFRPPLPPLARTSGALDVKRWRVAGISRLRRHRRRSRHRRTHRSHRRS
ncbi:hypothetical protein ACFQ7Z_20640 [Streptomyces virginiae]|uniref:hypothetical protein n=1 Tax=Streptomyces virginiae TaxID=1961 RepID=UPI0036811300